jgi:uncharacterized protein YecE (DUF72 family)
MSERYIGCAGLPPRSARPRYFNKLSFLESDVLTSNPAKPSVLKKWRAESPNAAFSLIAAAAAGPEAGVTPQSRHAVKDLALAVEALGANAVVFRTAPGFTPSATNRERLRAFFAEVATPEALGGAARVWEPQGLWQPQTAVKLAGENGLVYAGDPLTGDPLNELPPTFWAELPGNAAYFRLSGLGRGQRRIPELELEALAEIASIYDRLWVVFPALDGYTDAVRFRALLGELPAPSADDEDLDEEDLDDEGDADDDAADSDEDE